MVFAAWKWKINLKYNFGVVPGWGILFSVFQPHCGAFAAFRKQDDKYSTNAQGGGGKGGRGEGMGTLGND